MDSNVLYWDDDEYNRYLAMVELTRRYPTLLYMSDDDNENINYEFSAGMELARICGMEYLDRYTVRPIQERRIAGSRRVERYQLEHRHRKGQLLQSITAHPAISTRSFEELRAECYAESFNTQGKPPAPVDAVVSPEAVIPPLFNAYSDESDDILPNEITME